MNIGCILMAAGNSSRFSGNKLAAPFHGEPLIERALRVYGSVPFFRRVCITQYDFVEEAAKNAGFLTVRNPDPDAGASLTVRLGVERMRGADAVLFAVSDQPCLTGESVLRLIARFTSEPDCIHALSFGERRGNPVIFPIRYREELMCLTGDVGGSFVIKRHPEMLRLCPIPNEIELFDVDRAEDLISLDRERS